MRISLALGILGLGLLSSGCTLLSDSVGLVAYKVRETAEDFCERQRDRRWAADAWEEACGANYGQSHSEDYRRGFEDGFTDYLYKGGAGEPPLVPPKHYRALRYQSAQGYLAMLDWFAGYRHGAAVAQQSGYRQWVTGPTSLAPLAGLPALPAAFGPAASRLGEPAPWSTAKPPAPWPAGDLLPPPRKTGPAPAAPTKKLLEEKEVEPDGLGPKFPGQDTPVPPAGPALPERGAEMLPAVPLSSGRNAGVAPAALAVLPEGPPVLPPPSRSEGITIRPLLPAFADYEIQLRPVPWLPGQDWSLV